MGSCGPVTREEDEEGGDESQPSELEPHTVHVPLPGRRTSVSVN